MLCEADGNNVEVLRANSPCMGVHDSWFMVYGS